jgi:hypothetical protein
MLRDTEWTASQDFIKTVEHASQLISLLPFLDAGLVPFWLIESIMGTMQIHLVIICSLANYMGNEVHDDLRGRVETAIQVMEAVGGKRPSCVALAEMLKLAMSRMAHLPNEPPLEKVELDQMERLVVSSLGFQSIDAFLGALTAVFGRNSRMVNGLVLIKDCFAVL